MPTLTAGYSSCCVPNCLILDKSTLPRPCTKATTLKPQKDSSSKLKASISSWDGGRDAFGHLEAAEQADQPRDTGRSLYDSAPDIFDEEFPYSVANPRSEVAMMDEIPTEMIFKLNRRGSGWGEEIIPMLTIERRPLERQRPGARNRSKTPTPWQKGSLEDLLAQAGVVKDQVESVAAAAAAWRVTPGGRPLIDRRRRTRVTRNLPYVVKYLTTKCGIEPESVGAILTKSPQVLLANPKQHDRWLRRVIELAAFLHRFGHCNVPEKWPDSPSLAVWVERQRRAHVSLSEERLQILYAIGFDFDEKPIITQEWEASFDMLVEWLMWHKENHQVVNWNVMDWTRQMNPRTRHLAVWVQLQRELCSRELLPLEAKLRLHAIGFQWRTPGFAKQIKWMKQFGQLLFDIERRRMKSQMRGVFSPDEIEIQSDHSERTVLDVFSEHSRKSASGTWSSKEFERGTFFNGFTQETNEENIRFRRLDRLTNLQVSKETEYWLEKQRWLWRRGKLPRSKVAFLYCAGVELNAYTLEQWIQLGQKAANFLNGYEIWTKPPIEKPPASDAASLKENGAQDVRLYVAPADIKEILSDGGLIEWDHDRMCERQRPSNVAVMDDAEDTLSNNDTKSQDCPQIVSLRLSIRRWVLTQQALWREGRLSQEQLHHLAFLGLTWVLSPEITSMSDDRWKSRYHELTSVTQDLSQLECTQLPSRLHDWLMHQRGLRRLGWQTKNRINMLNELGFCWTFESRTVSEQQWDANLASLLEHKQENHNLQIPNEHPLRKWLVEQVDKIDKGSLPSLQCAQLKALGVARLLG